jgi:hypothetical protein
MPAPGAEGACALDYPMGRRCLQRHAATLRQVLQVRPEGRLADGAKLGRSRHWLRSLPGRAALASPDLWSAH